MKIKLLFALCIAINFLSCKTAPVNSLKKAPEDKPIVQGFLEKKDADNIINKFLVSHSLSWGKAVSVRNAPNRYIYFFSTPKAEVDSRGERRLVIDLRTGQVKKPCTSGGRFNDMGEGNEGRAY